MEMTWQERCIDALKFAVWVAKNPGGRYDEYKILYDRKTRTDFRSWSDRVEKYQKTGRWV